MAHPRTFRFGIQLHSASSGEDWAEQARKAEDLGYSTLFLPDHFGDQLAPIPAMVAAAAATTDLRVGCLVFDNDYRHPVVLAKEAATVDVLSGGRVELGLGAGPRAVGRLVPHRPGRRHGGHGPRGGCSGRNLSGHPGAGTISPCAACP